MKIEEDRYTASEQDNEILWIIEKIRIILALLYQQAQTEYLSALSNITQVESEIILARGRNNCHKNKCSNGIIIICTKVY